MITKEMLKKQIDGLPDEFTLEQLIEHLIFLDKINSGLEQSKNNQVVTSTSLKDQMTTWFA